MNRRISSRIALVGALALAAVAGTAQARDVAWSVGINSPGISVGVGAPAYGYAAPAYVAPAPVYYPPAPVYVAPRPVYVAPRPIYYAPPPPVYYGPPAYRGWHGGPPRGHWNHGHGHGGGGWRR